MKRGKEMASGKPVLPRMQALRAENRELREAVNGSIEQNLKQLAEIEGLKDKVAAYMESAGLYKNENEDLRARCEEVEEMLRQEETRLEIANKEKLEAYEEVDRLNLDAKRYQVTILELQKAKREAEDKAHIWYQGMVKSKERTDYWKEAYTKISFELEETKKSWWKKLFRRDK